jgi:nitroreductase
MTTPLAELDSALRRSGGPVFPHRAEAVVAAAVQAPSLHNAQPWRFRVRDDVLELRADRSRQLSATDPSGRQLTISCGAALLGARLAVHHLGHEANVRLLPEPADGDLLAEVRAGRPVPADEDVHRLLEAMARRRSHRGRFDAVPVPASTVVRLRAAAEKEGARLVLVNRPGARRAVADVVAAAERTQQSNPGVRAELEEWTPPAQSDRRDGVPADAYPQRPVSPGAQELTVRDFSAGRGQGVPSQPTLPVASAAPPVMAVLLSPYDGPADWLLAGQALHRVLLTAAVDGVQASLHGQPTELDGLRRLLQDELLVNEKPQMLLQLGHAPARGDDAAASTPRRTVQDVLDR